MPWLFKKITAVAGETDCCGSVLEEKLSRLSRQLDLSGLPPPSCGLSQLFCRRNRATGYSVEWWVDQEALPWLAPDGSLHASPAPFGDISPGIRQRSFRADNRYLASWRQQ